MSKEKMGWCEALFSWKPAPEWFYNSQMCPLADSDCSALESEKEHKSLGSFVKALSSFSRKKVSIWGCGKSMCLKIWSNAQMRNADSTAESGHPFFVLFSSLLIFF